LYIGILLSSPHLRNDRTTRKQRFGSPLDSHALDI
jgi:hypothetical protein